MSSDAIEQSLHSTNQQEYSNNITLISCLQISDTNIHLAKESYESSQQRDLQGAPAAADTCFTVHFTTSSLRTSKSKGNPTLPYYPTLSASGSKFYIAGYGDVPLKCQENGAECDITICGRTTLDIVATDRKKTWRFSITGHHIGPLVDHREHPISGKQNTIGGAFPTKMGGNWDLFQSYTLVKTPGTKEQEWIDNDPFSSSNDIIMVSRIVIRYIL